MVALGVGQASDIETADLATRLTATPLVLAGTWLLAALSYALVFKPSQRLKPLLEPAAAARRRRAR